VLAEGLARVQEPGDVAEMAAYPAEQFGGRCAGVGDRERVGGLLDSIECGGTDVARRGHTPQLPRLGLVVGRHRRCGRRLVGDHDR
jgi:hypothetical protein